MIKGVLCLDLGGNMKLRRLTALVLAGVMCLTAFTGWVVKADETAATLGDQKVTAGVVNFICKYQKNLFYLKWNEQEFVRLHILFCPLLPLLLQLQKF